MSITATQPRTPGWTPDDTTFGARLALVRQRMGWGNIAKAAKECGVPVDSWRNWEVDGREPHRLVTISMAIATRTGCDLDWLVYGPVRGDAVPSGRYGLEARIVATIALPAAAGESTQSLIRPVQRTRPIIDGSPRSLTLAGL